MPKTWKAKLEIDKQRCIVPMPDHLRKKWGDGTLLIPIPLAIAKSAFPSPLKSPAAIEYALPVTVYPPNGKNPVEAPARTVNETD